MMAGNQHAGMSHHAADTSADRQCSFRLRLLAGSGSDKHMQTDMLLADHGTTVHDTGPLRKQSICGGTPGILKDNDTTQWLRADEPLDVDAENVSGDGFLLKGLGILNSNVSCALCPC
jgi:hypothetical protein